MLYHILNPSSTVDFDLFERHDTYSFDDPFHVNVRYKPFLLITSPCSVQDIETTLTSLTFLHIAQLTTSWLHDIYTPIHRDIKHVVV